MAKKKKSAKSKSNSKKPTKSTAKTSKKTTSKKTSKAEAKPAKKVKVTKSSSKDQKSTKKTNSKKSFTKKTVIQAVVWVLVAILTFAVVDAMVFYLNNVYSAAIINGSRVSQSELDARLEEEYGKQVLSVMIEEELIRDEAAVNDVTVTEEEIDKYQANQVEQMGGEETFEQALKTEGMTIESYRRDVETILLAQKTVVEEPTEAQLMEFYELYKESYTALQETESYEEVDADELADIYVSQKFNEQAAAWLEGLRTDADIQNNLENKPKFRLFGVTNDVFQSLIDSYYSEE